MSHDVKILDRKLDRGLVDPHDEPISIDSAN